MGNSKGGDKGKYGDGVLFRMGPFPPLGIDKYSHIESDVKQVVQRVPVLLLLRKGVLE